MIFAGMSLACALQFAGCSSSEPPETPVLSADDKAAMEREAQEVENAEREQQKMQQAAAKKK
jgi:hypothetical protein